MDSEKYPIVSVMIATYNSSWILEKPLAALRAQSYPQDRLEILIIDGNSRDNTREIAALYSCRTLDNPKTDPVSAKLIGMQNASGRFLLTIDHDEVLTNPDSIKNRVDALLSHPECKVAMCSGYKCPQGYTGLNEYISEFGDPFSLFYYRFSKGYKYFIPIMNKRASMRHEYAKHLIYSFDRGTERIIVELICLGTLIDLDYFRSIYDLENGAGEFVHLFYTMVSRGDTEVIVSKDDPLEHYSVDGLRTYLPKLRWRIINNIHYADRAEQGFTGRQRLSHSALYRKYAFVFYVISTLFPIADGVTLFVSRRNKAFLLHPFLCWYVLVYIVYQYMRKLLRLTPKLKTYNGDALEAF